MANNCLFWIMKQLFIFLLTFVAIGCYGQTVVEFGPYDYGSIRNLKTQARIDKFPKKYANQQEKAYCEIYNDLIRIYLLIYDANNASDYEEIAAMQFDLRTANLSFYKDKTGSKIVSLKLADAETIFVAVKTDDEKTAILGYPLENKEYQMKHDTSQQALMWGGAFGVEGKILEPINFDRAFDEFVKKLSRCRVKYYRLQ